MRGLQGRTLMNLAMASCRVKPLHQYMYASAVAGARPKPASQHITSPSLFL
jgi:hypothetical protein